MGNAASKADDPYSMGSSTGFAIFYIFMPRSMMTIAAVCFKRIGLLQTRGGLMQPFGGALETVGNRLRRGPAAYAGYALFLDSVCVPNRAFGFPR